METVQLKQEEFNAFFSAFLSKRNQNPESLFGSPEKLFEAVDDCAARAKTCLGEADVVASEYYGVSALLCADYLNQQNGIVDPVFKKGKEMIARARKILPEDKEYQLFDILLELENDRGVSPEDRFDQLKQMHKECPSFKLMDNTLFKTDFLEDVYNGVFERKLSALIDELPTTDMARIEEAVEMLKEFPAVESKLKAYSYLSSLYFAQGKLDESLRTSKLGIELLGTSFPFDESNSSHLLWATCWTLVGRINRLKGEYDFAMSVFEKGEMLGIVPCIRQLAEMYKNGEGEDADEKEALRLTELADSIEEKKAREAREEQERIKREEEKRLREIQKKEEEFRIAEETKARQKEIKIRKGLLIAGIVAGLAGIIICLVNLGKESVLDKIAKYEKANMAILDARADKAHPFVVFMDKKGIYYDNMSQVKQVLVPGETMEAVEVSLPLENGSLRIVEKQSEQPLQILSSKGMSFRRISNSTFLVTKKKVNNPLNAEGELTDAYLVILLQSGAKKVIRVPQGRMDGSGNIILRFDGDLWNHYKPSFQKSFTPAQCSEIQKRNYCNYMAWVKISMHAGAVQEYGDVHFSSLQMDAPLQTVGGNGLYSKMSDKIRDIFKAEYIESLYQKAIKLTGVSARNQMRLSPDERSMIVIKSGVGAGKNSVGLLRVDNSSGTVSTIDTGSEISFEANSIHVKKHSKLLFILDYYKDIYYDFYGYQI